MGPALVSSSPGGGEGWASGLGAGPRLPYLGHEPTKHSLNAAAGEQAQESPGRLPRSGAGSEPCVMSSCCGWGPAPGNYTWEIPGDEWRGLLWAPSTRLGPQTPWAQTHQKAQLRGSGGGAGRWRREEKRGGRWRGALFPPLGCTIWSCIGVIFTESNKTMLSFMTKLVHCTGLYLKYFLIQIQIQK